MSEEKENPVATVEPVKQAVMKTAIKASHTLATLCVSLTTFNEIKSLLAAANYNHTFLDNGNMIDMTGIGLIAGNSQTISPVVEVIVNGIVCRFDLHIQGTLNYEQVKELAYPNGGPENPSCTWRSPTGGSGILTRDADVYLEEGLIINMIDTGNAQNTQRKMDRV